MTDLTDAELDRAAMRATGVLTPRIVAELRKWRKDGGSLAQRELSQHYESELRRVERENAALTAALAKPLLKYDSEGERLLPDSWTPVDAGRLAELEEAERDNIKLTAALKHACDWLKRLQEEYDPTDTEGGVLDIEILRRGELPTIAEADRLLGKSSCATHERCPNVMWHHESHSYHSSCPAGANCPSPKEWHLLGDQS